MSSALIVNVVLSVVVFAVIVGSLARSIMVRSAVVPPSRPTRFAG